MATIKARLLALEQQTGRKIIHSHLMHTYTDEVLLNFLGLPHDATDEQLLVIIQGKSEIAASTIWNNKS